MLRPKQLPSSAKGLMKIKVIYRGFLRFLGNRVLYYVINILCRSVKFRQTMPESTRELIKSDRNYIAAFWHGSMLAPWFVLRNSNFSAIVSKSKDGEILTNVLNKWGYKVVRGSSHKGGRAALQNMISNAISGHSIAITPDGPTGPPREMKPGAVITAKKTGLPIIFMASGYHSFIQFKSWDKFRVPKFFSRAEVLYSEPVYIDPELSFEETKSEIEKYNNYLNELQDKAENLCLKS